jgi:hypothetical protein
MHLPARVRLGSITPVDRWNFVVYSGGLKHFEVTIELQSLCIDYYRIQDYNNKAADWVGFEWERIHEDEELQVIRKWLLTELKELEEIDWLNPGPRMGASEADAYRKALQDGLRSSRPQRKAGSSSGNDEMARGHK